MGLIAASAANGRVILGFADSQADATAQITPLIAAGQPAGQITLWTGAVYEADLSLPAGWSLLSDYRVTGDGAGKMVERILSTAAQIRADAVAHANLCLNGMLPIWVMTPVGAFSAVNITRGGSPSRWWNTRMWIIGPLACIDALLDANRVTAARTALDAYRSLVPANSDNVEFWYRNHGAATWHGYAGVPANNQAAAAGLTVGHVRAYFGWRTSVAELPAFASDAAASTEWSGGAGTLEVEYLPTVTPESFAA